MATKMKNPSAQECAKGSGIATAAKHCDPENTQEISAAQELLWSMLEPALAAIGTRHADFVRGLIAQVRRGHAPSERQLAYLGSLRQQLREACASPYRLEL